MTTATIFNPWIQLASPTLIVDIKDAKIIRTRTEGKVKPKKEISPPNTPPRITPIPIPT